MTCQKTIKGELARGVSLLAPYVWPFPTTGIPKAHHGSQATLQLGAVLPVLSASSLARGQGTGCPHHPLDLDGFPRAAASSAEGQQSRARCQTPMARLFTEPVAGKGPAHIAYGETP